MPADPLQTLLLSIRLSVDTALTMLANDQAEPAVPAGECAHPTEQRRAANTMGKEQFLCMACNTVVVTKETPPVEPA